MFKIKVFWFIPILILFILAAAVSFSYLRNNTTESTVIETSIEKKEQVEEIPWQNSTCGNNVCEKCESSSECCNYQPVKDKNGNFIYPPPTCMGRCPKDCGTDGNDLTYEKYINGVITSFDNNLAADGNCVIVVNNMKIQIEPSGERLPTMIPKVKGTIQGIKCTGATDDLSSFIGKSVNAFGLWNGYYLSIEGNENYYIKLK